MKVFYNLFLTFICWAILCQPLLAQTTNFSAKVNFQDQNTVAPVDYVADFGQAYQPHADGLTYGWLSIATQAPIDLTTPGNGVGRNRNVPSVSLIQNTLVHMQGNDIGSWTGNRATESYWEIVVPNGSYQVSVSVGDPLKDSNANNVSVHHLNVEGVTAIADFPVNPNLPTGDPSRFKSATVTVEVTDGRLTIDPQSASSRNTKINSVEILPASVGGEETLEFSDAMLSMVLPEGGESTTSSNFISATNFTLTAVDVSLNAEEEGDTPTWLKVNGQLLDGSVVHNTAEAEIVFEFDPAGLGEGVYQATVTAEAPDQTMASFEAELTIIPSIPLSFPVKINFQNAQASPPNEWEIDYGAPYGVKPNGYQYGWVSTDGAKNPLNLTGNGRNRNVTGFDIIQNTLIHMQYGDVGGTSGVTEEGMWEIEVPNGDYQVTVTAGDLSNENLNGTEHRINVEGKNVLSYVAARGQRNIETNTDIIRVDDSRLTLDATEGFNTKIISVVIEESENSSQPQVLGTTIPDGEVDVELLPTISSLNLYLPNAGISPTTLNNSNVKLYEVIEDPEIQGGETLVNVLSTIGTSGGFDVISLTPNAPLKPNTRYKFEVTTDLTDQTEVPFIPFESYFTTGNGTSTYNGPISFGGRTTVATGGNGYTTLTIGPDQKLYGVTSDGYIKRWTIDRSTGLLNNEELITTIRDAEGGNRLVVGMAFAPDATAEDLQVWVSHTKYGFVDQPDFQGKISKLEGSNLQTITDYVIHLPRSKKDHVTNSVKFGPDGALYILQGSVSAMGAIDNAWNRHEILLSASMLRLDLDLIGSQNISLPIDAKTEEGGTYNPYAANAPLTLYADGVRNAYDMEWHSNGKLYVPTNGSAGLANAPGSDPGSTDYREPQYQTYSGPLVPYVSGITTQNDYLFRVEEGGYYGHPNPRRAEYVLNGGNPGTPTDWQDAIVPQYPVGTQADANYRGYSANLGHNKSPNGIIEYRSDAFNGELAGKLINVWYVPGKLVVMEPGNAPDYDIENVIDDIPSLTGFNKPLDVIEDVVTGNLYVSEYQDVQGGQGKITLLKPSIPPSTVEPLSEIHINFQDEASSTPAGWLKDFGEAYNLRSPVAQGGGQLTYGWLATDETTPLDLSDPGNGRARTSISNPLLATFMHMQGDDIADWGSGTSEEGVWGIALNNGFYEVTVSVGDADETGSTHHINAEGVNIIDRFQPTGANGSASRFSTATAGVQVTDGVLDIDAKEGGFNTKINSISIVPLDASLAPPALEVNLSGENFQQTFLNEVEISFTTTPNAPSASQVNLSYILYDQAGNQLQSGSGSDAWVLDQPGNYTLVVLGTDDAPTQNQTKVVKQFSIEAASGALISLENMTKIPNTNIGFPADSIYSFHRILNTTNTNGQTVRLHTTNTMRIHNPGVAALQINAMTISDETEFAINTIGGTAVANVVFPITVPVNGSLDVELQFVENSGGKGPRIQELIIASNADNASTYHVALFGNYMVNPESSYEVNSLQIFQALGFKTSMNGKPRPSSDPPTAVDVENGVHGDLIISSVFEQADPSQPVRAFQLAAFKGPGNAVTRLIEANSDNLIVDQAGNQFSYNYGSLWHQGLFPKTNNNATNKVIAGDFSNRITQPFRIQVDFYRSSGGNAGNQLVDQVQGVRIYKVVNYAGEVVPNHYIVIQDYVGSGCGEGSANCDWNDNVQYFMNIKPVNDPSVSSALEDILASTGDNITYNASTAFDHGYPGNKFKYTAQLSNGSPLPGWLSIDENTGEIRGTVPIQATAPIDIKVTATDLNGIEVSDPELTTFRISFEEGGQGQDIWIEAECGVIGSNWNVESLAEASQGTYLTIRPGLNSHGAAPTSVSGHLSYTFTAADAGVYQIYARARATNSSNDSFWVRIDGGTWSQWNVAPSTGSNFAWREVSVLSTGFTAGSTHTLDIAYREDGTDLDKLYLTTNDIAPQGLGEMATNCSNGGNLAPIADAGDDINITDSDSNGSETVLLDGSASDDDDGTLVSYSWSNGITVVGTSPTVSVEAPVGSTVYTLTVTDNEGATAADDVVVTVNEAGFGSGDLWIEAECGAIGANWNVESLAEASQGTYITIRPGLNSNGAAPASSAGHASYTFTASEMGIYQIYARVRASNYSNDSFWVRIDGGVWLQWNIVPLAGTGFAWREVSVLSPGFTAGSTHTLDIAYREDGADLDKLYLTTNDIAPEGLGETAINCGESQRIAQNAKMNQASDLSIDLSGDTCEGCSDILVYPNPTTNGDVHIEFLNMYLFDSFELRVINAQGQILQSHLVKDTQNTTQMDLNLENVGSGIYLIQIITKDQVFQKQILKL